MLKIDYTIKAEYIHVNIRGSDKGLIVTFLSKNKGDRFGAKYLLPYSCSDVREFVEFCAQHSQIRPEILIESTVGYSGNWVSSFVELTESRVICLRRGEEVR